MQTSFQLSHDPFLTSARAHLLGVVGLTALKVRRWCRGWAEEDRGKIQAPHTRWCGNRQATGGDCECRGKITGHTFEMVECSWVKLFCFLWILMIHCLFHLSKFKDVHCNHVVPHFEKHSLTLSKAFWLLNVWLLAAINTKQSQVTLW